MGNTNKNVSSEEPKPDTYLQSTSLFLRKKKILMEDPVNHSFVVFDTLRGQRKVTINPYDSVLSICLNVVDGETLLSSLTPEREFHLISTQDGKITSTHRLVPEIGHSRLLVIDGWIYSHKSNSIIRVRTDFSEWEEVFFRTGNRIRAGGKAKCVCSLGMRTKECETTEFPLSVSIAEVASSVDVSSVGSFYDFLRVGDNIVSLYLSRDPDRGEKKVVVWDLKDLRPIKMFSMHIHRGITAVKEFDSETLAVFSTHCEVFLAGIHTGEVSTFTHPRLRSLPLLKSLEVVYASTRDRKVFVSTRNDDVKLLVLHKDATGNVVQDEKITNIGSVEGILTLEDSRIFALSKDGRFELWRVGWTRECLCRGRIEEEPYSPTLLSLTQRENKDETLRFRRELENQVSQVPKELLEIIAGFI